MSVNNKLKLGICFKKAAQYFFFQSWLDPTIIYRHPVLMFFEILKVQYLIELTKLTYFDFYLPLFMQNINFEK
jgi:hypothetical protein